MMFNGNQTRHDIILNSGFRYVVVRIDHGGSHVAVAANDDRLGAFGMLGLYDGHYIYDMVEHKKLDTDHIATEPK